MTKREVEKYIKNKALFDHPAIKRLGRGNNSDAFLIIDKSKKYTFRIGRKNQLSKNKLHQHFVALKFLEHENIGFAPRATFFDKNNQVLITTYISGEPIENSGLNKKQLDLFVRQIVKLYSLKYERYKKFCKKYEIYAETPETPTEKIRLYGVDKFKYLKNNCKDKEIVDWIKPRLDENIGHVKKIKWNKNNLIYSHGDLTGANIIKFGEEINFIDWEQARFVYSNDFSLSYKFVHFDFFGKNQDEIIRLFAKYFKKDIEKIKKAVHIGMKVIKINDIIWAAMMYTELYKKKQRGWKKYHKLTRRRIKEYEEMI